MLKIEKGIPYPGRRVGRYPWHEMEVGDSVFFDDSYKVSTVRQSSYNHGRKHGKKFGYSKVQGGFRIWRIA